MIAKSPRSSIVQFHNVVKRFPALGQDVEVLHNISFEIKEGSFTILHGPSGSGKTTILNSLIGLEAPTSGTVYIGGTDLYELSADRRARFRGSNIGMVYQDNHWVSSLSVAENVALPLLLTGWNKHKALWLAQQSIARVGLEKYAHYSPLVLSGGQQQRISFARATVVRPKILVADEPTGNLDSLSGQLIIRLLQDFNGSYGATVVLVTHNDDLLPIADTVLTIHDGRLQQPVDAIHRPAAADVVRRVK
ncbi:MAG: ABC transporter ATP-binding protein [Candidatus Saccharimonadales bacterium]